MKTLQNYLFNAIIGWYDNSIEEYHGLDDPGFIEKVCKNIGISEEDYRSLVLTNDSENCSWNSKEENEYYILSNNSDCDDLSIYRSNGTLHDAYKKMQALIISTGAMAGEDDYMEVYTDLSELTGSIQYADSHTSFRIIKAADVTDINESDGVADANLDAIPDEINWDNEDSHYALHDVGRE